MEARRTLIIISVSLAPSSLRKTHDSSSTPSYASNRRLLAMSGVPHTKDAATEDDAAYLATLYPLAPASLVAAAKASIKAPCSSAEQECVFFAP